MRIVRLGSDDNFQQILRESRENSRAPILNRASVNNGQTSFNGNESLIVTGSQKVTGWLIVTGTLKGVGTLLWEQVVNFTGAFTSTGPTKLNGPTEITDTLDVSAETLLRGATTIENTLDVAAETTLRGALQLLADLVVQGGGRITLGSVTLDPGLNSGGSIGGLSAPVAIILQAPSVRFSGGINAEGNVSTERNVFATLSVQSADIVATDNLKMTEPPTKAGVTSNLYWDNADNTIKRIV
jgi:hypothetical protein